MADQKIKIPALPATTTVTDLDKFIIYQNGTTKRVDYTYVKSLLTGSDVIKGTFSNSDLVANVLTIEHGKNTEDVMLIIRTPDKTREPILEKIVDANTITVDFGGAITGTWSYLLAYWNSGTPAAPTTLHKKIDIGSWDMDAVNYKSIAHGLDFSKIIRVTAMIFNDAGTKKNNFEGGYDNAAYIETDDTYITMVRGSVSNFDSPGYADTVPNRGILYIDYES